MITTQKVNKFVNLDSRFRGNDIKGSGNDRECGNGKILIYKGHDASCPQKKLGNDIRRAQFIVPLQHNYN
jgi:hypothetical protein